jgi:hypothetical protein
MALCLARHFLNLPAEVRDQVYQFVLPQYVELSIVSGFDDDGPNSSHRVQISCSKSGGHDAPEDGHPPLAVLLVCRQVHHEYAPKIYGHLFCLVSYRDDLVDLRNLVSTVGPSNARFVKNLKYDIPYTAALQHARLHDDILALPSLEFLWIDSPFWDGFGDETEPTAAREKRLYLILRDILHAHAKLTRLIVACPNEVADPPDYPVNNWCLLVSDGYVLLKDVCSSARSIS